MSVASIDILARVSLLFGLPIGSWTKLHWNKRDLIAV